MKISISGLILILGIPLSASAAEPVDSMAGERLDEVVVTGNSARQRIAGARLGAERLELSNLVQVPSFGGEADILKSIALLPGVRGEGEGGGGFEVRGGNASQNLVLLDGISLYNPSHVMGIFSAFNDNALGGATLYKGALPAMFGGASSSVLDISLAPGDMERFHGSATVGILAAKVKAEGPIVRDKLSLAVAARRSYADVFLKLVPQYRTTVMNFYDVSAKLRWSPSPGQMVDGTFFASRDNMAVSDLMGMYWGNIGGAVNWTAHSGKRLAFVTTAALTHFDPRMETNIMDNSQTMWTYIHNYSVNEKLRWHVAESHSIEFGLRSELLRVKSAEWVLNALREREVRSLWENSCWVDYSGSPGGGFDVTAGVRLNVSSVLAGHGFHEFESLLAGPVRSEGKTYVGAEPRVSLKYNISSRHNVKVGFGVASQNLHAIRANTTTFPFDRYALTSASVRPECSRQYGAGYSGMSESGAWDWSAEAYWRGIDNVYDFKDGRGTFSDIALEKIILGGRGRGYGAEFMVRKNTGRLTGWISYTISRTETRIPGINGGEWYKASNDRLHDFSVAAIFRLADRWSLSGSWIFMSGQPLTAPDVKYEIGGETCYYYSKRNAYKTPPVHRLDLSARYSGEGRKLAYEWAFGIYNTYCRYNPFAVYFEDDASKPSGTRAVVQAMYGLVPSVSYTLKF